MRYIPTLTTASNEIMGFEVNVYSNEGIYKGKVSAIYKRTKIPYSLNEANLIYVNGIAEKGAKFSAKEIDEACKEIVKKIWGIP